MSDTRANIRQPLFHMVARDALPPVKAAAYRLLAVVAALCTGGLFLLALGLNPIAVYGTLISGALGSESNIRETVKIAIPLCMTALGILLAFKMKFWNIGAEGQICIGAIAASYFAYRHNTLPSWLLLIVMAIVGILLAGLWGMIPAWFKTRFGTNETLFTLMMNYVALYMIQYLREGPWKDPKSMGFPQMPRFAASARMPVVLGVHIGWIVALALVVAVLLYLRYTKQGYELTVVGENENTARYAGMPVKKIVLRTMFLSAGICGLAGVMKVSGADRVLTESVAGGVGFTAITVAWLARLSPVGIMVVSVLFGVLEKGCGTIQSVFKISTSVAQVLQGIILFFVLGAEFFLTYRLMMRKESQRKEAES